MVADEFGNHLPVWFPSPIYDDATQMPVSSQLLDQLRAWNLDLAAAQAGINSMSDYHARGLTLAARLAEELGPRYEVHYRSAQWEIVRNTAVAEGPDEASA